MNLQALSSLHMLVPRLRDFRWNLEEINYVFQLYMFHQPGLLCNAARIWELMSQVRYLMRPGMLLRSGPPPQPSLLLPAPDKSEHLCSAAGD